MLRIITVYRNTALKVLVTPTTSAVMSSCILHSGEVLLYTSFQPNLPLPVGTRRHG